MLELYAIADGHAEPGSDDPQVVICLDEFGPLNLQPHPGRHWARRAGCAGERRRRRRATYTRPHGVRHLLAAYDLKRDRLYGHITTRKGRLVRAALSAISGKVLLRSEAGVPIEPPRAPALDEPRAFSGQA